MLTLCYRMDEHEYERNAAEAGIPDYMVPGIFRYVEDGIQPGGFLGAVLSNNLRQACNYADIHNGKCLKKWVLFLTWCVPANCHGSPELVRNWMQTKAGEAKVEGK